MTSVVLKAENITKRFGGILALDHVCLELKAGEVHALMGENGAGKSTLGKIIAGIYSMDDGAIFVEDVETEIANTNEASKAGIGIVLQEFNLLGNLSVAENVFFNEPSYYRFGLADFARMRTESSQLLALFGLGNKVDPRGKISELSIAEMQIIEILKVVRRNVKVLILDEPTAALTRVEIDQLFRIVEDLKARGVAIVMVSHKIEEIFQIADRVTVLRDGKQVLDGVPIQELDENKLVHAMIGRNIEDLYGWRNKQQLATRPTVLEASHIRDKRGRVKDISFTLQEGEILGIAGLIGAGRTELVRAVFGADPADGSVIVCGKELHPMDVQKSIANGIAMVPEDRKNDGLLLSLSLIANMTFAKMASERTQLPSQRKESKLVTDMTSELDIRYHSLTNSVGSLSGGNQQKTMLAKWLMVSPKILIVDEPTRGIDISAKYEIYTILNRLATSGVSIIMVSSEMPEIIGMCDRVLVIRDGYIARELIGPEISEESIAVASLISSDGTRMTTESVKHSS